MKYVRSLRILCLLSLLPALLVPDATLYANAADVALNIAPFSQPLTVSDEHISALKVYLTARMKAIASDPTALQNLSLSHFPDHLFYDKRIVVHSLTAEADAEADALFQLVCEVNGEFFIARIVPVREEIVSVRLADGRSARTFPAVGSASDADLSNARALATDILAEREYVFDAGDRRMVDDLRILSAGLRSLLRRGFENGLFNTVAGVTDFFDVTPDAFAGLSLVSWARPPYSQTLNAMIERLVAADQPAAENIALMTSAVSRIFYATRTPEGYRASAFFSRCAYELFPDDFDYGHNLYFALKHAGRIEEAYALIDRLLERHPDRFVTVVDRVNISLDIIYARLKKLQRDRAATLAMPLDEAMAAFADMNAELRGFIGELKTLKSFKRRPRALSMAGYASYLLAYLGELKTAYYAAHPSVEGAASRSAEAALGVIVSIREGTGALKAATALPTSKAGEAQHARDMYIDIAEKNGVVLERWYETVRSDGIVFPDRLARLRDSLASLRASLAGTEAASSRLAVAAARIADEWVPFWERLDVIARDAIGHCTEADADDENAFFARLSSSLAAVAAADETLPYRDSSETAQAIDRYVAYYRQTIGLDRTALAIIHVSRTVLTDAKRRTMEAIDEMLRVYDIVLAPDDLAARVGILNTLFALDVHLAEAPAEAEEPKMREPRVDLTGQVIDRTTLESAIEAGNGKNLIGRYARLTRRMSVLALWDGYYGIAQGYIVRLKGDVFSLGQTIESLAGKIRGYLERSKTAKGPERRDLASTGRQLSGDYLRARAQLDTLTGLLDKRIGAVTIIIDDAIADIEKQRDRYAERYGYLDVAWLHDQLAVMSECIPELRSLARNEDDDDYLSVETFTALREEAASAGFALDQFGRRLDSYKEVFDVIASARREIAETRAFFNIDSSSSAASALAGFEDVLAGLDRDIFAWSVEGKTYDRLSTDEQAGIADIVTRVEYLARVRCEFDRMITDAAHEFFTAEGPAFAATPEGAEEYSRLIADVTAMAKTDFAPATAAGRTFSLVRWLSDIHAPCPHQDDVEDILEKARRKITLVFGLHFIIPNVEWQSFCADSAMLRAAAPEDYIAADETAAFDLYAEMTALRDDVRRLDIFDRHFYDTLDQVETAAVERNAELRLIKQHAYRSFAERLKVEVAMLKKFADTWFAEWFGDDAVTADERAALAALFDRFAETLPDASIDPQPMYRARKAVKALVELYAERESPLKAMSDSYIRTMVKTLCDMHFFQETLFAEHGIDRNDPEITVIWSPPNPVFRDGRVIDVEMSTVICRKERPIALDVRNFLDYFSSEQQRIGPAHHEIFSSSVDSLQRWLVETCNKHVLPQAYRAQAALSAVHDPAVEERLTINSGHCRRLIVEALDLYCSLAMLELTFTVEGRNSSFALPDVLREAMVQIDGQRDEQFLSAGSAKHEEYIAQKREAFYKGAFNRLPFGRGFMSQERAVFAEMVDRITESVVANSSGQRNDRSRQIFARSVYALLERVTGEPSGVDVDAIPFRQTDAPRPMMTAVPGETTRIRAARPARQEYRGVYFDPELSSFATAHFEGNGAAAALAAALNTAFSSYLALLRGDGTDGAYGAGRSDWSEHLHTLFAGLKENGRPLMVAVSDGLEFNSMAVGDTLIFNAAFVEYLVPYLAQDESARIILGERIFHELGHIARESTLTDLDEDERALEAEVRQVVADVAFYDRIFGARPDRGAGVDLFVHRAVGGDGTKFSSVFRSAYLFTKIGEWAALYRRGEDAAMKQAIRLHVIEMMRTIRHGRFERPFPAVELPGQVLDRLLVRTDPTIDDLRLAWGALGAFTGDAFMAGVHLFCARINEHGVAAIARTPHEAQALYILLADAYGAIGNNAKAALCRSRAAAVAEVLPPASMSDLPSGAITEKVVSRLRARGCAVPDECHTASVEGKAMARVVVRFAETVSPARREAPSLELAVLTNEACRIGALEEEMLNGLEGRDGKFLAKKRVVVISEGLVPLCQRKLAAEIAARSAAAFAERRTGELIRVASFDEIRAMRSDETTDIVLLLEQGEAERYEGRERMLGFGRTGDAPVLLNGFVAAGRALLYDEMERLRAILTRLSGDPALVLPDVRELERLLKDDTIAFSRALFITLPAVSRLDAADIADLNRAILAVMHFV